MRLRRPWQASSRSAPGSCEPRRPSPPP
jgi:hypothetical protein